MNMRIYENVNITKDLTTKTLQEKGNSSNIDSNSSSLKIFMHKFK